MPWPDHNQAIPWACALNQCVRESEWAWLCVRASDRRVSSSRAEHTQAAAIAAKIAEDNSGMQANDAEGHSNIQCDNDQQ